MVRNPTPEEDAAWTPYGDGRADCGQLAITAKPRDDKGRHLVTAKLGTLIHKHRFDCDSQFHRRQFREAVVSKFSLPDDSHEAIETLLTTAAEAADNQSEDALWTPQTINLADVKSKAVRWFWHEVMPEGAFSVLDADPNEGKTTVAVSIGARYTNGHPMPPHATHFAGCESGNVLFMSAEDDLCRTIAPRFQAAEADMSRVHFLRSVSIEGEDERSIQLPRDIAIIEREIMGKKIGFMVVDVLAAFVQPGIDLNSDSAARQVTTPLVAMLERTRATALVLRHLNKKENLRGMYRGGGSVGVIAAARAAFTIAPHPDEAGVKVFAPIKHNLGPKPSALTFSIEAHGGSSRIAWGGETELSASDVLHPQKQSSGGKVEVAMDVIEGILSAGPRGENEVRTACEDAGISRSTYWRARKELGVQAEHVPEFQGEWLLSLNSSNGHVADPF